MKRHSDYLVTIQRRVDPIRWTRAWRWRNGKFVGRRTAAATIHKTGSWLTLLVEARRLHLTNLHFLTSAGNYNASCSRKVQPSKAQRSSWNRLLVNDKDYINICIIKSRRWKRMTWCDGQLYVLFVRSIELDQTTRCSRIQLYCAALDAVNNNRFETCFFYMLLAGYRPVQLSDCFRRHACVTAVIVRLRICHESNIKTSLLIASLCTQWPFAYYTTIIYWQYFIFLSTSLKVW